MGATKWQRTPQAVELDDYFYMIVKGIKNLYILTGRGGIDVESMIDDNGEFSAPLNLTEQSIVLDYAKIEFYDMVRSDKNSIVGYTTDALTVTHADKPHLYLTGTIEELRKNIRVSYYKLIQYVGE